MDTKEAIIAQITAAFARATYPGDCCLIDHPNWGEEPFRVEQAFLGKTDWRNIDPTFLDLAPNGLASALSFFSNRAFLFYIPAYMIADIRGQLQNTNPVFHLTHGLSEPSKSALIKISRQFNPAEHGPLTWFERAQRKFHQFTSLESKAVVAYLKFIRENDEFQRDSIDEALKVYWQRRADGETV